MEATPPFRSYNTTYQGCGAAVEAAEQGEAAAALYQRYFGNLQIAGPTKTMISYRLQFSTAVRLMIGMDRGAVHGQRSQTTAQACQGSVRPLH